ncbi:MAG: 4Fe-4S binding protein [Elusimicrobiota bacterium]|jgi:ferredoxin|nr:4Fe-4S binding protein [Elusimicrobiota bacterium]
MIASVSFGLFFGGWSIAFRFLDPFSNFGSIISSTVSLIYSKIIPTDFADKTYVIKFFSTGIIPLFVIVFLVLWKKRIFCVAICPVGTLLGLFSKWGLFRLKINEKCVKCSKCASICGAGAIDLKEKKINNETCMRCLKCIDHCPIKAIQYGIGKKETRKTLIFNPSRREFLATGIGVVIAIACSKISGYVKPSEKALLNKNFSTIFPPGSVSSDLFLSKCTSCLLCLNNCKGGAIKSPNSKVETVYLDYNKGFCHYECNNCSQVCPTGAIRKISLEEKKITRIGMAVFNYETCLKCKICYAKCPTGAIKLNENGFPLLEGQYCIGCGSCQYNCPAKGEKYPAVRIVASFAQAEATATVSK